MLVRMVPRGRSRTNIIRALFSFFIAHGFLDAPTRTYIACAAAYLRLEMRLSCIYVHFHSCSYSFCYPCTTLVETLEHPGGSGVDRHDSMQYLEEYTTMAASEQTRHLHILRHHGRSIRGEATRNHTTHRRSRGGCRGGVAFYRWALACCVHAGLSTVQREISDIVGIVGIAICIYITLWVMLNSCDSSHDLRLKISRAHKKKIACTAIGVAVAHIAYTEGVLRGYPCAAFQTPNFLK